MTESTGGSVLCEVCDLRKSYWLDGQEIEVLRGADLVIQRGEQVSLIGPSGSGKSTFLHVLGTLDTPTSGRLLFEGLDPFGLKPGELAAFRNQSIGFVFQFHHLLPEFTALENVTMPALIQRMNPARALKKAKDILSIVGLEHRMEHRPGELSGGEQQRVAIARALVLSPKLLLADEPTGNLDEHSAQGVHELLDGLNRETGLTILLVTHNSTLAGRMHRQLQMKGGQPVDV